MRRGLGLTNGHNNKLQASLAILDRRARMVVALASTALICACGDEQGSRPMGTFGPAGPVSVIATEISGRRFVDEFTALGTARANESIEVTSRITSVVTRINFEEDQQVTAGTVLVELDNREIRADLAMAQASLQQKRSQYERSRTLQETQVVSEADLEQLEADVLMAEAEVRAAQARLDDSLIRAPFSGTVGLRRISPGDLVGPETMITTLDDTLTIKLEFTVPETFLASIESGMDISAKSDVYPTRSFFGLVSKIDPRVDAATRSVTVIAQLPNDEQLIRPGMFLTVDLVKERENVLLIPEEALVPRQGRQYVFVIEEGRAIEKQVELGARAPGLAEIRSGLTAGEIVITEGTQKVRNGAAVQVVSNT